MEKLKILKKYLGILFILAAFLSVIGKSVINSLKTREDHTALLILLALFVYSFFQLYRKIKKRRANPRGTLGKARFAEQVEVLKTGLTGPGIVFGKMKGKLITKPPTVEGHTLVVGGTGRGKSRGVVIPTLMQWQYSALVMDIKGELSKITKDKRKGAVYIFNPEADGACYDPIELCDSVENAQELSRILIPTPKKGEPFWCQSAQAVLAAFAYEGAVYHYKLSDIAEKICTTPISELVEHCRTHPLREVRVLASITYDMPEKTLGGVVAELKSKLITIATDSNIRRATSKSDFTPHTLEEGATIYLRVSEHLLEQYRDLWTIIINQFLRYLSTREERKQPPVLIALDELPRLGEIKGLTNALATLRSRNVHILGVIQSMAQLDEIYTPNQRKIIADNCSFKFILSATDPETQKYFSDLAGQKTVMTTGYSSSRGGIGMSIQEQSTPLVRPEEWANLEKPILFAPKLQPIQLELAFWDKEKRLA
jgi:type IV secretion system protein VirD4